MHSSQSVLLFRSKASGANAVFPILPQIQVRRAWAKECDNEKMQSPCNINRSNNCLRKQFIGKDGKKWPSRQGGRSHQIFGWTLQGSPFRPRKQQTKQHPTRPTPQRAATFVQRSLRKQEHGWKEHDINNSNSRSSRSSTVHSMLKIQLCLSES